MDYTPLLKENRESLHNNAYPGRGIILGQSPNGDHYIQIYWIMGRSENSRNRIFIEENGFIKTQAIDPNKVTDPDRIIYYPIKSYRACHIVSNGDQTDTIYAALKSGSTFEQALFSRTFEPDAPHFTPRIAGLINLEDRQQAYQLAIIKAAHNDPNHCLRHFYHYAQAIPGLGHCIHTYASDGNPLPPFEGEPFLVALFDDIDQVATDYWNLLNFDNKVALAVKFIHQESGRTTLRIINKHGSCPDSRSSI